MRKVLRQKFFERKVVEVAQDLVGKYIVSKDFKSDTLKAYRIIETEAYDGEKDLACHAAKGRTQRTEVLYGRAGHLYVYLIYGMHYLLNVVSDKKGYPAGVLIRGIENEKGKIVGPGRVAKALLIDKTFHGKMSGKDLGIWFEDRGGEKPKITKTPRIGIDYAGPIWSKKKYRFIAQ